MRTFAVVCCDVVWCSSVHQYICLFCCVDGYANILWVVRRKSCFVVGVYDVDESQMMYAKSTTLCLSCEPNLVWPLLHRYCMVELTVMRPFTAWWDMRYLVLCCISYLIPTVLRCSNAWLYLDVDLIAVWNEHSLACMYACWGLVIIGTCTRNWSI